MRRAVAVGEVDIRRAGGDGIVRNRFEPRRHCIGTGKDGDNARDGFGGGGVVPLDPRVGVGGAYDRRKGLARYVDVVAENASADQQPPIFLAENRIADFRSCSAVH